MAVRLHFRKKFVTKLDRFLAISEFWCLAWLLRTLNLAPRVRSCLLRRKVGLFWTLARTCHNQFHRRVEVSVQFWPGNEEGGPKKNKEKRRKNIIYVVLTRVKHSFIMNRSLLCFMNDCSDDNFLRIDTSKTAISPGKTMARRNSVTTADCRSTLTTLWSKRCESGCELSSCAKVRFEHPLCICYLPKSARKSQFQSAASSFLHSRARQTTQFHSRATMSSSKDRRAPSYGKNNIGNKVSSLLVPIPRGAFYNPVDQNYAQHVVSFASFSPLTNNPQQNYLPPHSTSGGTVVDGQSSEIADRPDQGYEPLNTPQQWPCHTENSHGQLEQQNGPSLPILNIGPEDFEELNWPFPEIGTNSPNDQSGFAEQYEQQQPVGNGPSVNPLFNPDRADSNKQTWEFLDRLLEESKIDSQSNVGDETIFNEDVSSNMGSTTNSESPTSQTETGSAMSNASVEEMVDSPSTSSGSSSVAQQGDPDAAYRELRKRNNESCKKSRAKKAAKQKKMEEAMKRYKKELKELESQNKALRADVARLKAQKKSKY
uniref:BZIP domain-containing protein n=1 Tax=Plectus sambesii TaxID=2011161 RepID=A0A914VXE7_9BILA